MSDFEKKNNDDVSTYVGAPRLDDNKGYDPEKASASDSAGVAHGTILVDGHGELLEHG